jgi:xylose isomerase
MLKDKAAKFNADKDIQAILAEIKVEDPAMQAYLGKYTSEKAQALKAQSFDRHAIASRGLKYERLDQLTIDLLLGNR